jgi:ketosteroid isomerase-like protein
MMNRKLVVLMIAMVMLSCANGDEPGGMGALDEMIASEREFARTSVESGAKKAFLAFLADDAVLFPNSGPTPGRDFMAQGPELPGQLSWEPGFADMAAAGDLGYSTGPWKFALDPVEGQAEQPAGHGHFFSVWERQPDASWKVLLDIGIDHPNPGPFPTGVATPPMDDIGALEGDAVAERDALLKLDQALSDASDFGPALIASAADSIRLYRFGTLPIVGKEASLAALSGQPVGISWAPIDAGVSSSLDFGYVYGTGELLAEDLPPEIPNRVSYVRVWRRRAGGSWKIEVDVVIPFFEPEPEP